MKIVLTNDDGYDSPGIQALFDAFSSDHDTWIVAPDSDKSGSSHCMTLKGAVKVKKADDRRYCCYGTPVDCVLLSALGAVDEKPDVLISGINLGPNLGSDITFSGTTAAARQGTIMGIPSLAVSLCAEKPPFHFACAVDFVKNNLDTFISLWTAEHFVNINVPNIDTSCNDIEITTLSRLSYSGHLHGFASPRGEWYYFFRGSPEESKPEPGTDMAAVSSGKISVSPVYILPVLDEQIHSYKNTTFT